MPRKPSRLALLLLLVCAVEPVRAIRQLPGVYDIRSFGARGDGKSVDSDAINEAIEAAAAAGGGIVDFPPGRYLSFSIRLKSHVTIRFSPGAVLVAGDPSSGLGKYDAPEPNPSDRYQDFGHSHWRNSLISGIDVEDVAIVGPGLIDGRGLTRAKPGDRLRNITISNCVFDRSRGLAIETVDGGALEDIVATNLTMRDVTTAPIFLRIGRRGRGPEGTPVGSIRRVLISHVVAYNAEARFASIIAGIPGHPVEDVTLSDIRIVYRGGGTDADAKREPLEVEDAYPEPSMFGTVPAAGFYVRHARGISMRDIVVTTMSPDDRPRMVLQDAHNVTLDHVEAPRQGTTPFATLRDVTDLSVRNVSGVADRRHARISSGTLPYEAQ
jgi:polygalacturonase